MLAKKVKYNRSYQRRLRARGRGRGGKQGGRYNRGEVNTNRIQVPVCDECFRTRSCGERRTGETSCELKKHRPVDRTVSGLAIVMGRKESTVTFPSFIHVVCNLRNMTQSQAFTWCSRRGLSVLVTHVDAAIRYVRGNGASSKLENRRGYTQLNDDTLFTSRLSPVSAYCAQLQCTTEFAPP